MKQSPLIGLASASATAWVEPMDARGEERRFDFRAILGDPALVTRHS
jgi:hypothetical protein